MATYEEIGRRVRQARSELGWLQADLGRTLSRPRSHAAISDIERGKTKLDLEELAELARVLQKPLAYFTEAAPQAELGPRMVYHRSDRDAPASQKERSVEAFKQRARERARGSAGS